MRWLRPLLFGFVLGLLLLPAASAPVVSVVCLAGCSSSPGTINNANSGQATSATNTSTVAWTYGYNGATWDALQVDASKYLKVNCASGCAGGSFNNNADNVATSATNGQSAAWNYLWDGAAWDRAPGNATDGTLVNLGANNDVTASQTGTWTVQPGNTANTTPWLVQSVPGASNGLTKFNLTAAASTNATSVKAGAGTLYHIEGFGVSATQAWVTFYNTAGVPVCGTGIVYQTIIPGVATGAGAVIDIAQGLDFSTGIGICVTTGIAGSGAVAANTFVVNLGYK